MWNILGKRSNTRKPMRFTLHFPLVERHDFTGRFFKKKLHLFYFFIKCFAVGLKLQHAKALSLASGYEQVFFQGVLGTRFGSLEFQIGSLESEKIIIGSLKS